MRIDNVFIEDFKNLKEFRIDFDETKMKTVLLGQNTTGKSNFIEALVLIFKYLDLSNETKRQFPCFDFSIEYKINDKKIYIRNKKSKYEILVNEKKIKSFKSFFSREGKKLYQPKYVFTYYSGLSNKLKEHFWEHQEKFYDRIIKPDFKEDELDSLRKLFYVQLVHSYFVLLAYFSFAEEEKESIKFLKDVLDIIDIESILFILKMPNWAKNQIKKNPDDRFWTSKGLVRQFLDLLWEYSLAPIYHHEKIKIDFKSDVPQDRLYLYVSTKEKLKALASKFESNTGFFKALESTYISKLIAEVRIKVIKTSIDEGITFKDLSEGEQQLLTVLGLLKFTKDEESLILLDEPDTHLNPIWKWKYFEYLDKVVKEHDTTQIIISTHDPLVIGSLTKEEVRVFKSDDGKVIAEQPDIDPRGLGVAGILTSELFGLPTILDKETQAKLNRKRYLQGRLMREDLSKQDYSEYQKLKAELEKYGFYEEVEDVWFKEYLAEMSKHKIFQKVEFTAKEKAFLKEESKKAAQRVLELMKREDIK